MVIDLKLDDIVRLKKAHPCGGYEWTVVRLGGDIGIVCKGCEHRVMLSRSALQRRVKTVNAAKV